MYFSKWLKTNCFSNRLSSNSASNSMPQHITSSSDRFWLRITRTLPADLIGAEVSPAVMEKAFNRRRIGINIGMCVATMVTCIILINSYKRRRNEELKERDFRYVK